jgi:hypothetical protein
MTADTFAVKNVDDLVVTMGCNYLASEILNGHTLHIRLFVAPQEVRIES